MLCCAVLLAPNGEILAIRLVLIQLNLRKSKVKPKPMVTHSHTFPFESHRLRLFASSFVSWAKILSFVIGQRDYDSQ